MIGLALMLILGATQIAILSVTQLSADGGAFVAAHMLAAEPTASPLATVQSIFPGIKAGNLSASNAGQNLEQATVTTSAGGFSLPGFPSSFPITGSDLEVAPASVDVAAQTYTFGATAQLLNYCPRNAVCSYPSIRSIYIAHTLSTGGNGVNGQFAEWICHAGYLSSMGYPATRPTPGARWDPTETQSGSEYTIYSWDTGTPCS
ncbi:MAG TPA: hypothetical protein VFW34_04515 [Candidatus Rubrimentiphilum sp.]|nr:hypothetical protein [Candidatus Rubrimentiphilum sp.]